MLKRTLIVAHRWLGVALCLVFLLWFPSGIGMMYWDFPSVTPADRLAHSPAIDPAAIRLSPAAAAAKAEIDPSAQVRVNTFDGRPVYRFRTGREETVVYADTGEPQDEISKALVDRIAAAWSGQPIATATVEPVEEMDQWTVQTRLREVTPLWKYSWLDGQQVYASQASGEVVQYTTTASRWGAYVGAIPHWLYFTPLRRQGPRWNQVVIWSSGIGTVSALLGMVVGVWMYSPAKRYRSRGVPTSIPYRGQKRWHLILGLIFGLGAVTWAFSGLLSMEPFPLERPGPAGRGARRGEGAGIPQALRGRGTPLASFDRKPPQEALAQLSNLPIKELVLTTFAGEPIYLATLAGGGTRIVPIDGAPSAEVDRQRLVEVITKAGQVSGGAEVTVLAQYDRYYLDRRRLRPLPVIVAVLGDADHSRYYIDPKTARVVGTYSARSWMSRWLYHSLHSLDFPWLYNHRPLWDIVVITFMLGGTALGVTSLILAWRVLGRKLRAAIGSSARRRAANEDLVQES